MQAGESLWNDVLRLVDDYRKLFSLRVQRSVQAAFFTITLALVAAFVASLTWILVIAVIGVALYESGTNLIAIISFTALLNAITVGACVLLAKKSILRISFRSQLVSPAANSKANPKINPIVTAAKA